ncbi:KdsC family phosphatase [Zavarzinella formosa]|uniref:KdsC family phosphatase n=1 Tax=Zavarzinella formosa TaxID=360055 RepID=UPI000378434A|nr:HAD-IIIA family hydrolase [Zavarzinella formosa]
MEQARRVIAAKPDPETIEAIRAVQLLVLDVDGVLTDGKIVYTDAGHEIKSFHVRDGSALKFWMESGKQVAIISGRSSPAVERRARELGITVVVQGARNKMPALRDVLKHFQLDPGQACAIGDDLADYPVLQTCGIGVAVADACRELKSVARYVTSAPGGCGAVRETIEWLMGHQGSWQTLLSRLAAG